MQQMHRTNIYEHSLAIPQEEDNKQSYNGLDEDSWLRAFWYENYKTKYYRQQQTRKPVWGNWMRTLLTKLRRRVNFIDRAHY